jgi:hypothetical protein
LSWERWAGAAGFSLGIEVGPTDREIRAHYADSGNRRNEAVAFFLIAAADLALARAPRPAPAGAPNDAPA